MPVTETLAVGLVLLREWIVFWERVAPPLATAIWLMPITDDVAPIPRLGADVVMFLIVLPVMAGCARSLRIPMVSDAVPGALLVIGAVALPTVLFAMVAVTPALALVFARMPNIDRFPAEDAVMLPMLLLEILALLVLKLEIA
jgi:hypothetical protein